METGNNWIQIGNDNIDKSIKLKGLSICVRDFDQEQGNMIFDLDYIDRLISPEILEHAESIHSDMTFSEAIEYYEQRGLRYELEERAAILEYDGGLSRDEAEKQAVKEMMKKCIYLIII